MAGTVTVGGIDRSALVPRDTVDWAESAYLGEVATGRFTIHDAVGTVTAPGFKTVTYDEGVASPVRTFTGFVGRKGIGRGDSAYTGAAREIAIETKDSNDLLQRLICRGTAAKRPSETVGARVTWLLASGFLDANDFGRVTYPDDTGMDAADYRGQYPGDVLAACAKAVRFNYYVRWNAGSADYELVFRDDNAGTADTSTVTISNAAGSANGTSVFAPVMDAELSQDPEHVYSGAYYAYAKGNGYTTRAATGTAFAERDGVTEDSGDRTSATAARNATTFLHESRDEEQLLPVTLRMRAAYVNKILPGDRVNVTMTHMNPEGWASGRYARVLRRRVTQPLNLDNDYDVQFDLSPQEDGPSTGAIVQSAFEHISAGETVELPNPVTVGNLLVFAIGQRNFANPASPGTVASQANWGTASWTKLPNVTAGQRDDGVAIYYKVADSTSSSGYVGATNAVCGIFELSGVTVTGAATASKDEQAANTTMDIGSLGTPASGSFCLQVGMYFDQKNTSDGTYPAYTPGAGWTLAGIEGLGLHPSYFGGIIEWNAPLIWIAYQVTDGSAVSATGTRSGLLHEDGRWGGAAVALPPE